MTSNDDDDDSIPPPPSYPPPPLSPVGEDVEIQSTPVLERLNKGEAPESNHKDKKKIESPSSVPSQSPSTNPSLSPSLSPSLDPTTTPSMRRPYSDLEACLIPHELDKAANSGADAKFLLHLGDIRDGKPYVNSGGQPRPCPEYLYEDVATIFEKSFLPTFFSMGDNAWLDCEDPDESYTFWKKHLCACDWQGLPGEGWSDDHAWNQWNVYLDENARWMEKSFAENEFKAVIICGNSSKGWNERYFLRLEEVAKQNPDVPIMFLGDEHEFQEEPEFRGIPNLHRIALDDVVTPTLITVDPYATGTLNVFTYDRRCPCAGNHGRPSCLLTPVEFVQVFATQMICV
ncbi:hypothetical protein QTG54_008311 [Skeletonema marinoi]|uniref:Calcineurin-like phosphoesterase domain-containing protein n=1 Tax=Skeletonema marinoi TaxID=267567 RepID=A0AAD9DCN2_9STRA|nr:hypothetical protein QTG54_008311 [Skeletonema marinoi]